MRGTLRGAMPATARNHGANVIRRRAAAAAQHIEEPAGRELTEDGRGLLRALVVLAERIRQARIRVGAHEDVGYARQLLDVGTQLLAAERAIESDDGGPRVAYGIPEGLGGLTRERASRGVADRARDDDGQIRRTVIQHGAHREQRRFGVQGIEHGLDQDHIGAALDEGAYRLRVAGHQLIEADIAKSRIVDVGRERGGAAGRSQRAGDEALPAGLRAHVVRHLAREARGAQIEFPHQGLHSVVRLRHRAGVEGVGGDDIRSGEQVLAVDGGDDLGLGERQQVVIAA